MTAAAAPESILACADEATGVVAFPEAGGAAGAAAASATATVTGIAVAMAFVAAVASCCAEAAGSVEEPVAEVSPDDDFAADFAVSDFGLPDFALEGCGASALALAPEGGVAEAP